MKRYLVDTVATVLFFTVAAGLSELFIAGMDPSQVLIARLITIPMIVMTARPYGLWRSYIFKRLKPHGQVTKTLTDILAFLTFQVPVYVVTLMIAGASVTEIIAAVGGAILSMALLSRPFGLFLDAIRLWARVEA